jgi:predicted dehydrogenase
MLDGRTLDFRPSVPDGFRPGIAIVGCGGVVGDGHLPAYSKYGFNVVGLHDRTPEKAAALARRFGVGRVFPTLDDVLGDESVEIVDVATRVEGRIELIERALRAGKHVLAQKPLAGDLDAAAAAVAAADAAGRRLAVNQNGRWAPAWRAATLLVERGAIGDAFAVTHVLDKALDFVLASPRVNALEHFLIHDYAVHWIDISRCWLDGKEPVSVRAAEHRTPNQPRETGGGWAGTIDVLYTDGSSASIRSAGRAVTARPSCPFWIHGTDGTIRGSVLHGSDFVELERDGSVERVELAGEWWPDGFAGTMGELVTALAEDREPFNSARHNLLSLELTLAACASSEQSGAPVAV